MNENFSDVPNEDESSEIKHAHKIESECTTYVGPKEIREKDSLSSDNHKNAPRRWYLNNHRNKRRM